MKVKDLIKKLNELNPEATVIVASSNFELGNSDIEAKYVNESNEGQEKLDTFRDAFDGESYSTKIWRQFGGDQPVVKIS